MAKAKILVSDSISSQGLEILKDGGNFDVDYLPEITPDDLEKVIGEYDALVVRSRTKVTADILQNATNLKAIGRAGVGLDNVDLLTATRKGIIVMNAPSGNTISTCELTISMMLALSRNVPQADRSMHEGRWDKKVYAGVEVYGKTLGIIGLGRIGTEVAKRASSFGMRILGFDPFVSKDNLMKLGIEPASVAKIVKESDFITVHTTMTPETKGIIGEKEFAQMKDGVRIINCARGGIIDENALVEALKSGKVAGAGLDVYETEPPSDNHPLRSMANVVLTPHLGASTKEAQLNVAVQVAEQIVDVLNGKEIRNAANAPSVDPEILSEMQPYLNLAERMGKLHAQLTKSQISKLNVKLSGAVLDFPTDPIVTAVVKGFLEPISDEPINYVNAMPRIQEMGIEVVESKSTKMYQYSNLITVDAHLNDKEISSLSGTLFTPHNSRLVIFNDKHFDAIPEGNMIIVGNKDVPGVIGSVGTLLGKHGINIAQMTWGRSEKSKDALTIINVDQEISSEIVEELSQLPNILSIQVTQL